jgi:hypothetical protein
MISGLLSQIPYSTEQGIIFAKQGILAQEQRILPAKNPSHRRMRFSVHTGKHHMRRLAGESGARDVVLHYIDAG